MTTEEIYEKWTLPQSNKQASVDLWDSMAPGFGLGELPNAGNNSFMRLLKARDMYGPNAVVLDVGCGTGHYSIALAKQCKAVIGVDLSPRMLDIARKKAADEGVTNVEFICLDWHALDLQDAGYVKAFDLVFAHMTPAIQSADTFMKLSEASRGWCAMSKPTKRTDPVSDALKKLVGIEERRESSDEAIEYAFSLLWKTGVLPYFAYEKQQWNMLKDMDEAYGLYINRLKTYREITSAEEEMAKNHLQSIAVNGVVSEQTQTTVTTMYWKIQD